MRGSKKDEGRIEGGRMKKKRCEDAAGVIIESTGMVVHFVSI